MFSPVVNGAAAGPASALKPLSASRLFAAHDHRKERFLMVSLESFS